MLAAGRDVHLVVDRGRGLLNALPRSVMFVCSVGTLLFNGNPLLRYDGYYILAGLASRCRTLRRRRSRAASRRWWTRWCFGIETLTDRPMRRMMCAVGCAATCRGVGRVSPVCRGGDPVVFERMLKPYGLEMLARLIGMVVIGAMIAVPAVLGRCPLDLGSAEERTVELGTIHHSGRSGGGQR